MKSDIFSLVTSAAWRKLQRFCLEPDPDARPSLTAVQMHGLSAVSIPPYTQEDCSFHLLELAKENPAAACGLSFYRASLIFTYRHLISGDFGRANEEAHTAITSLLEGLNRIGIGTQLDQRDILSRARCLVNSLASQVELQQELIQGRLANNILFVLGMHRSGTSALTGMLAQAGFAVPSDLMPATVANPKGYWESMGIFEANEKLLKELESPWDSFIALPPDWKHSISAREWRTSLIKVISEIYSPAQVTTIKDPRFCSLISGLEPWLESKLIDVSFVIPIRHPFEVANSLLVAEGTNLVQAIRLWLISIFLAEHATRGYNRRFISFDALIETPGQVLEACIQLVRATGTPVQSMPIADPKNPDHAELILHATAFIEPSLRRQRPEIAQKVAAEVTSVTANSKLLQLAVTTYRAILENIDDDQTIAKALDEQWPHVLHASG